MVAYATHVNLGFNRGAELPDPARILKGTGKSIRHVAIRSHDELESPTLRRYLHAALEQAPRAFKPPAGCSTPCSRR